MLTIFGIPKPFAGHVGVIQRNAIRSWKLLGPQVEVILCGDDEGVAEAAAEIGAMHLPGIARNAYGTPLLSSAFDIVQRVARHRLICYVNSDIILLPDFIDKVSRIPQKRFLALGQRWDLDIDFPLDFQKVGWEVELLEMVKARGTLQPPYAIDYFVFPKCLRIEMPGFAVGRPAWDNWLVYKMRYLGVPVIDMTADVTVVHQNHGYNHVKGRTGPRWEGPEAEENARLARDMPDGFGVHDATYVLVKRKVRKAFVPPHITYKLNRHACLPSRFGLLEPVLKRVFWRVYHLQGRLPASVWQCLVYYLTP